jgi:peptidoglycan/LPS O-acetylase OafA/YrhL
VLAYHLGFGWMGGGYLGVDLFFVLSGFLITSLLFEEWVSTGAIGLVAFWARRVRRLLPALLLLLVGIGLFVVCEGRLGSPGATAQLDLSGIRGDGLATLLYLANWHAIFAHESYFAHFGLPSPLQHTWSLAIEGQFYIVWPLLLVLLLKWARSSGRAIGLAATVTGAAGSAGLMAPMYHAGTNPTRLYYGTDTRMSDMLVGAALAMVVSARPQPAAMARRALHVAGPVAAIALGAAWVLAGAAGPGGGAAGVPPGWMFEGGFLICAVLAAIVVADVAQFQSGTLGSLLGLAPLSWIGRISYGIYLFHWPIFVYMTAQRTGLSQPWLDLARVGLTVGISAASYHFIETPIRRGQLSGWPRWALAPACALATALAVVVATVPALAAPTSKVPSAAPALVIRPMALGARSAAAELVAGPPGAAAAAMVPGGGGYAGEQPIPLPADTVLSRARPLRVMLIGDSMMKGAELGMNAALDSTGEVVVADRSIDGFGLSVDRIWRRSLPELIAQVRPDIIIGTWGWDGTCTWDPQIQHQPCALQEPVDYKHELEQAVRLMLSPGDGVSGVIFAQYPLLGPLKASTGPDQRAAGADREAGEAAWQEIVASMPSEFPRRVMYLPVGSSVLLQGRFSAWLPPSTRPAAPRSQWVRVRMEDEVHLCPAGVTRYADAILADLTAIYRLAPASPRWWDGSWVDDPGYNDPPGSCPDDHPPRT